MRKICVAVDGTAGSGKSFIFKKVADKIDYQLFDTGLLYRAFTLHFFDKNLDWNDESAIIKALNDFKFDIQNERVFVNDADVTKLLSTDKVTNNINHVTAIKEVRDHMNKIERKIGYQPGMIELGRDITTVVLPDADLKIYLDAPLEIRAKRRYDQNISEGIDEPYDQVFKKISNRDYFDKHRKEGPLVKSPDAWFLDTSKFYDSDELVSTVVKKIQEIEKKVNNG